MSASLVSLLQRALRSTRVATLAIVLPTLALAQGVVVSPPTLVIDHRVRSGALELFNPGDRAVEVRVETLFGYPVTDGAGHFSLATPAEVPTGMRAATAWVEAFPARLTIPGSGRQTVRFLTRAPADLADGEYFTRLVVTSKFAANAASDAAADIRTELSLEVRAVTTLLYRKGSVAPTVALANVAGQQRADSLELRVDVVPGGSAAFLGTLTYTLEDASGAVRAQVEQPVSIYVPVRPRAVLPLANLPPGAYRLRVRANAVRGDLPSNLILAAPPAESSTTVNIAPR